MIPAMTCIQKQKKSKPTLWKHGILYPSHIRIGYRLKVFLLLMSTGFGITGNLVTVRYPVLVQ